MKIIKSDKKGIIEAVKVLKKGGIIIYPTETSYGLGADLFSKVAVKKIFKIKKRKSSKALTIVVSDLKMAKKYARFDNLSLGLAKKHWPGPLTIVLNQKTQKKNKKIISDISKKGTWDFGIRVPGNKFSRNLIKKFGKPITSTSANISGQKECYNINEIKKQFGSNKFQPDLVLDSGRLPKMPVSTVVKVEKNKIKVLRKGPIVMGSEDGD